MFAFGEFFPHKPPIDLIGESTFTAQPNSATVSAALRGPAEFQWRTCRFRTRRKQNELKRFRISPSRCGAAGLAALVLPPWRLRGRSAAAIDRTIDRHRAANFDAGPGAGNIDKAGAVRAARLRTLARARLGRGRRLRPRRRRIRIDKRLRTGALADRDGEHGGRRYHGGAAERQTVSHGAHSSTPA